MDDAPEPSAFTVNENSSVYYGNDYWNDLPEVVAWLNEKVSGNPQDYWGRHLAATSGRTFKRALVLNCGNGNGGRPARVRRSIRAARHQHGEVPRRRVRSRRQPRGRASHRLHRSGLP